MNVVGGGKIRDELTRRFGFDLRQRGDLVIKGNRQIRPAITLAETNKNAVAAKSKQ